RLLRYARSWISQRKCLVTRSAARRSTGETTGATATAMMPVMADSTDVATGPDRRRDGTGWVALAAALWGSDAYLRSHLVESIPAATVVLAEHAIVVVLLLPLIVR